jgi:hypothetical protein
MWLRAVASFPYPSTVQSSRTTCNLQLKVPWVIEGGYSNNVAHQYVTGGAGNEGFGTITLPAPATLFGYGYSIWRTVIIPDATTITLFSGATNVGSLSYTGVPDPKYSGGFAGIQSTISFDSVKVEFSMLEVWEFDNVTFNSAAIPESSTAILMAFGFLVLGCLRRQFKRRCHRRKIITSATMRVNERATSKLARRKREFFWPQMSFRACRAHVCCLSLLLGITFPQVTASASVIAVGTGAFPMLSTRITFEDVVAGSSIHGLSVGGVEFAYNLQTRVGWITEAPLTNNVALLSVHSMSDSAGFITMTLPAPATLFGYGYILLSQSTVPEGTTITLFSGATNVGSLSYTGVPDPYYSGGFAGIQSTTPFDNVKVVFNATQVNIWVFDNVMFNSAAIPESSTVVLMGFGFVVVGCLRSHFKR